MLTVVQYASSGIGTPTVKYSLRASEKDDIIVSGTYSSTNNTNSWQNVCSGAYYIAIENIGNVTVSGNGYVQ